MANTKAADGGMSGMKWVWMLVGIAATGLFFWWIAVTSEPSQVMVMTDDTADESAAAPGATGTEVALADLLGTPAQYVGQAVQVPSATVTQVMGDNAFWVQGPGDNPFLVVKSEEFTATGGAAVRSGASISITGQFWEQSPSTIQQWRDSGFMTDAGHLAQAEFATHYIQARSIAPAQAGGASAGQ